MTPAARPTLTLTLTIRHRPRQGYPDEFNRALTKAFWERALSNAPKYKDPMLEVLAIEVTPPPTPQDVGTNINPTPSQGPAIPDPDHSSRRAEDVLTGDLDPPCPGGGHKVSRSRKGAK